MTNAAVVNALLARLYFAPTPGFGPNRPVRPPPSPERRAAMASAVARMEADGVEWTPDVIDLIAGGDQDYAQDAFGTVDGYAELNAVLGDLFQGK